MQNIVYIRLIVYVLSSLLGLIPPALTGWGVSFDAAAGVLSVNIEALAAAIATAFTASGVIFKLWGTK